MEPEDPELVFSSSTMLPEIMEDNDTLILEYADNCTGCLNELCIADEDYQLYRSFVSVDTFEMVLIALNIIVFLAGIMGNLLVIIAVTTTKSMQSVTNIFIVNLAMADMLVMLFCAPPSVIWDVTNTWIFGSLMCRIVIYIQDISVSVSVLTLTFIAYDRYNAICRPLQFSTRKTKAAAVIGAIWTISSMIGIPDAVTLHLVTPFTKDAYPCMEDDILFDLSRCRPTWSDSVDFSFTIVKGIVLYTLPLIFMSIAYYFIVKTLWRRNNLPTTQDATDTTSSALTAAGGSGGVHNHQDHIQNISGGGGATNITNGHGNGINRATTLRAMRFVGRANNGRSEENSRNNPSGPANSASRNLDNQLKTRRKVAKMLIAVVIMFSINFFPVHFLPICQFILNKTVEEGPTKEKWILFFQNAAIITHCMCYFNSAINPIIYYFMSAQFKAQYRRILSCRCTADTPQMDYTRYLAGRGQQPQGVLAAPVVPGSTCGHSQRLLRPKENHSRARLALSNPEEIRLTEMRPASNHRCIESQVIVERPLHDEEATPFIMSASQVDGNGSAKV